MALVVGFPQQALRLPTGPPFIQGGANIVHELVKDGWWYRKHAPEDATLENLEGKAREAKRGLWIDLQSVPPWEYRKA